MTKNNPDSAAPPSPAPTATDGVPDSEYEFVPPPHVCELMSGIAKNRAGGWKICFELFARPTRECVERLRSGEMLEQIRAATEWMNEDSARFMSTEMILETFARRSRRHTLDEDFQELLEEHDRLWGNENLWLEHFDNMVSSCLKEANVWQLAKHEEAKELRVTQKTYLEEHFNPNFPRWAGDLYSKTTKMIYRTAARFALAYLSFETGRDFDQTIFGDDAASD